MSHHSSGGYLRDGAGQPLPRHPPQQNPITNDSFQMGATPILAATRPYDNTTAVEEFLTTGVPGGARDNASSSQTGIAGAGGTTAAPPIQTSAQSSFAVPSSWKRNAPPSLASTAQPGDFLGSSSTSRGPPPLPGNHADPQAMARVSPRTQQVPPPLVTTASSTRPPGSSTAAPVLTTFQRHTGRSPTSQVPGASGFPAAASPRTGSQASLPSTGSPLHAQHTGGMGSQFRAADEALRRSPHGNARPQLHRTRSDRELTTLFASEAGGGGGAGGMSSAVGSRAGGRISPSTLHSVNSGGYSARGPYNASSQQQSSSGSRQSAPMPGGKPQWLNAVERMRRSDAVNEPVLPLDQSKLGMAAHRAQQQGVLTAAQLRSHAEQVAAGNAGYGGRSSPGPRQQQQQLPQPLYATSFSPAERRSPFGVPGNSAMPLRAQEATLHGSDSRSNGIGSEGSNWRRGHVRSVAAAPSRATVSTGGRVSAGGRVSPHTGNTPVGSNNFNANTMSYSAMNADPFLGAQNRSSPRRESASKPAALPALFAAEVHEAEAVTGADSTKNGGQPRSTKSNPNRRERKGGKGGGGGGGDDDGGDGDKGDKGDGKGKKNDHLEEDERDEQMLRSRDYNALHAIPWEQRQTTPMTGFGTRLFAVLASPRIWEKLDWTLRGAVLTILPTMVLSLEPATAPKFPMASSLAFTAFWITMPTFGGGLRELFIALKGFCMGLVFVLITVAINPPDWGVILCLFFFTLICAFVAEQSRKTIAYVLSSSLMQLISDREGTNFTYVGIYYEAILVSLAFGTAAFLVPFIRWSSRAAKHYIKALGNALSIEVQGMASSFWVRNPLERELNVVRLRQLRHTAEECMKKISVAISETGYEPHSGKFVSMLKDRFRFCQSIHNVLGSLSQVVELLADNPELTDTPMCNTFGVQISDDLAVIASAMDSMILKIVDFSRIVTVEEIFFFQQARERFQEALSRVREAVILTNEDYDTDESDVFLGFFMFSIDEICETIAGFQEDPSPRNNLVYWLTFWIRDVKSSLVAFRSLFLTIYYNRSITRRLKEAIKLSLCMALPVIFQVYALKNQPTSPMAGASIIAFMYNPTGSESFHYCSGRLLGTVLGSTASLLSVQIANGRRGVLYVFIALLSIISCYVQAAPEFYSLGNAMACSTISITTQYKDQNAAMLRIQQNCFAILIYFFIISVLWPMHGRTKVKMGLDVSLRCLRESAARLLCNLDMPYDAEEVVTDVSALLLEMRKKIGSQDKFIPGAVEEPTLSSAEFPADAWKRIVEAEKSIHSTLSMMRFAYREFMSSRADPDTELSVHWVVLHRIAPHAKDLSDLIYATVDLHLLSLSKTTVVPISQLTRLRRGMLDSQREVLQTYISTISRKIAGGESDEEGEEYDEEDEFYDGGSYNSSLPAPPPDGHSDSHSDKRDDGNDSEHSGDQKPKKKRADRSSHDGSDSSDGDDGSGSGSESEKPKRKPQKKTGYLGYKLTAEEAKALKDFINNGRVPGVGNASFSAVAGQNNASFSPASFGTNNAATSFAATSKRSFTNNMSMTRVPQALADALADNPAWKTGALAQHGNNDGRMMALAGNDDGLAARLRKKHHLNKKSDADDQGDDKKDDRDEGDLVLKNKSFANNRSFDKNASFFLKNTSFLGKMFRRRKNDYQDDLDAEDDNDDDEVTGSPAQRQLTDAMSRASSRETSPRRRRGKPSGRSWSSASAASAASAASLASRLSHGGADKASEDPLGRTRQGNPENPLMSSSLKEATASKADSSGHEMPEILKDAELKLDDPSGEAHLGTVGAISTAQASSDLKGVTASPETTKPSEPACDDDGHAVKSAHSSGGTGSTERKVVSAKNDSCSTTKSSPDRDLDKAKKPTKASDDAMESTSNSLSPQQLLQSSLGAGGGDSQGPPNGALGNISFFDPESGEFILTNHDIHSLEAFLFGTRALVVYLNDLQKSILEMQHASELAKKL